MRAWKIDEKILNLEYYQKIKKKRAFDDLLLKWSYNPKINVKFIKVFYVVKNSN